MWYLEYERRGKEPRLFPLGIEHVEDRERALRKAELMWGFFRARNLFEKDPIEMEWLGEAHLVWKEEVRDGEPGRH